MVCIVLGPEMMDVWRICSGQGQPPRCPACRQQYPVGPDAVTILQGYGTSCQVQAFGAQAKVQVDTIFTVPCLILQKEALGQFSIVPQNFLRERRSEEHTTELQSLMRNSYSVYCLHKKTKKSTTICL